MTNRRKAIVVHSPHSGKAAQLQQAIAHLHANSVEIIDVLSIATLDGLSAQGLQWQEQGIDIIVAAGGDGLIGGVTNHIAEGGPPLGILPLGTSNDVARSLRIPQDLHRAARVIANGQIAEVDVGVAQPAQQAPYTAAKHHEQAPKAHHQQHGFFAHALTVGLNVEFARLATNVVTRQHYGRMTYPFVAFEVLRHHAGLEMELTFTDLKLAPRARETQAPLKERATLSCRALQATVINAPIFGGTWQLSVPRATLHDGLLDILVIEDIDLVSLNTTLTRFFSRWEQHAEEPQEWHQRYPDLYPAELTGIPSIHHIQARGVTINTLAGSQDVTLDGEIRAQTPVDVQMAAEKLRVAVPRS
ncbi:MAG TPA: diacylglycerol kinase family protein [Ktedonobacteraceae bacterium]|nr:diacylglycerol kinase family protein [Ktedonobacteraceae bacterium]